MILQELKFTPQAFLAKLKDDMTAFLKHEFTTKWQAQQFKLCLETFCTEEVVVLMDYSENVPIEYFEEVQSLHWVTSAITLLVFVVYYHAADSTPSSRNIVKEYHYFASDDLDKDSEFTHTAIHGFVENMEARKLWKGSITHMIIWSDGCAAQFKSRGMVCSLS
jgi:hypothetical protein